MAKIKVELEVGSEFCDNCPMFKLFPHRDREAVCCLYNIPLTFSPRYLGYVRCDKCKQAEVEECGVAYAEKWIKNDAPTNCRNCVHRYGNTCKLFDRELTSYGNVGDVDWGYVRCNECKQAEVKEQ